MMLRGTIIIDGMELSATISVPHKITGRIVKYRNGKLRVYKNENGRQVHLGYYASEIDAQRAARAGRNLTPAKPVNDGIHKTARGYRVSLTLRRGHTVKLGEYATKGNALLVRDVVARRAGIAALVPDYEMPLAFVTNPVARSYITDIVRPATIEETTIFFIRVASLNDGN